MPITMQSKSVNYMFFNGVELYIYAYPFKLHEVDASCRTYFDYYARIKRNRSNAIMYKNVD